MAGPSIDSDGQLNCRLLASAGRSAATAHQHCQRIETLAPLGSLLIFRRHGIFENIFDDGGDFFDIGMFNSDLTWNAITK